MPQQFESSQDSWTNCCDNLAISCWISAQLDRLWSVLRQPAIACIVADARLVVDKPVVADMVPVAEDNQIVVVEDNQIVVVEDNQIVVVEDKQVVVEDKQVVVEDKQVVVAEGKVPEPEILVAPCFNWKRCQT